MATFNTFKERKGTPSKELKKHMGMLSHQTEAMNKEMKMIKNKKWIGILELESVITEMDD